MPTTITEPALPTVPIRKDLFRRLALLAARADRKVEEVLDDVLTDALTRAESTPTPPQPAMTFEEIFAPLHEGFKESGMTDEELGAFIDAEIKAYRAERWEREQQNSD